MKFGLVLNHHKERVPEAVKKLGAIAASCGGELLLDAEDAAMIPAREGIEVVDSKTLLQTADVLLAVGGDGTMLSASRLSLKREIPVCGYNLGRVGFLATMEQGEEADLVRLMTGGGSIKKRSLVQANVGQSSPIYAINELLLMRDTLSKTPEFSVAVDGVSLGDFRADGLVFATPTGSTAYAMAAGGPILSPEIPCILMSPICPIGKRRQSMVFPSHSQITLMPRLRRGASLYLMSDGKKACDLADGQEVQITLPTKTLQLLSVGGDRFLTACNEKLWGDDAK